jgi:alpha-glucoside transport system substrate-binding protein
MRYTAIGIALRIASGLVLIALVFFAGGRPGTGSGGPAPAGTVTVVASWTGPEQKDFYKKVIVPFENRTGIQVHYTGTRALDQLLQSDIQQGDPPDLAILPSPGTLLSYREQHYLQPLDTGLSPQEIAADYGPQWLNIMKLGTSLIYTLPVKADLQNLIWYNPRQLLGDTVPGQTQPPSWAGLTTLEGEISAKGGTPWCLGLDSPPTSGWLGTDWIGDILLHQSGTSVYQAWADGTLPWTSSQVRVAWQAWGSLVAGPGKVNGGSTGALVTNWFEAGERMFDKSPDCSLQYVPSFITVDYPGFNGNPQPGTGYNFFPSPMTGLPNTTPGASSDAWNVSADLLGMFNLTPDAQQLVRYLASVDAQRIWPGIRAGGAISADSQVPLSAYPDQVDAAIARIMTKPGQTLCFNASDLMPATMQNAFYQAVMEYLQNPSELMNILKRLDRIRPTAYQEAFTSPPQFTCGT